LIHGRLATTSIGSSAPHGRCAARARTPRTSSRTPTPASWRARAWYATTTTSATSCAPCATPTSPSAAPPPGAPRGAGLEPEALNLPDLRTGTQPPAAAEAREVFAAIAALPANYRDALVAIDVAGLSYKEAAKALRVREGTLTSRLYRARSQVAKSLSTW
jgi:DNA-directed RNA polymerase specialized sigma24 family protein